MSIAETACHSTPEEAGLRVETIPFDQIPQQTRLFLDYLHDPIALRRFYPEAVRSHYEVAERREKIEHHRNCLSQYPGTSRTAR